MPKKAPLVPIDLLRTPTFRISVIASVCCFIGQAAGIVSLPFYLQHEFSLSPLMTGFYMTPWPLMVAITAPLASRLANRHSTGSLCLVGGLCLAAGLAAAGLWPLKDKAEPLILATSMCGVGFGLFNVSNNRNMFLSVPSERSGSAGGIQGMARLIGQTSGAVMMTLLFTFCSMETAPRIGLAVGAVLTLTAGLISMMRNESTSRS